MEIEIVELLGVQVELRDEHVTFSTLNDDGHRSTTAPSRLILVAVWSLRLSVYLHWRNWGHGEDRRYVKMREKHGGYFWWVSLFSVFLLQGVILWFVSLPIQVAAVRSLSTSFSLLDVLGTISWAVGLFFESVGDWQLRGIHRDSHSRILIKEIKFRESRREGRFPVVQISALQAGRSLAEIRETAQEDGTGGLGSHC